MYLSVDRYKILDNSFFIYFLAGLKQSLHTSLNLRFLPFLFALYGIKTKYICNIMKKW